MGLVCRFSSLSPIVSSVSWAAVASVTKSKGAQILSLQLRRFRCSNRSWNGL